MGWSASIGPAKRGGGLAPPRSITAVVLPAVDQVRFTSVLLLLLAIRQRGATAGPPPIVVTGGGLAGQAGDARIGHEPNAVGTPPAPVLSLYLTDQRGAPPPT